jgi:hypothetical protein
MIKRWPPCIVGSSAKPWVRLVALTFYYLVIFMGLIMLYGKGDFSTPSFIYQNF